jgi:hypothetical protein
MLTIRGALADLDGSLFENTINQLIEQMRPPKGQAWDSRDHRAADALVQLCQRAHEPCDCDESTPTRASKPLLQVQVPLSGPATVAGVPLPDAVVEQLRANALIEPVLVDDHGTVVAVRRLFPGFRRSSPGRSCCVTGTAAAAPAMLGSACRSTTSCRGRGVAATMFPTSPWCAPHAATTRC